MNDTSVIGHAPAADAIAQTLETVSTPTLILDRDRMRDDTRVALAHLGINLRSLRVPVRNLSGGQRQALAVARSINWATTAVLMDEPTAALGPKQSRLVVLNHAHESIASQCFSAEIMDLFMWCIDSFVG